MEEDKAYRWLHDKKGVQDEGRETKCTAISVVERDGWKEAVGRERRRYTQCVNGV